MILPILIISFLSITTFASELTYQISISPPSTAGAPATIRVDDGTGLVAAQARLDDSGDWQDLPMLIEFGWAHFDMPYSGRIYISLTDDKGDVHVASEQVNLPPSSVPAPLPEEENANKVTDNSAIDDREAEWVQAQPAGATGSVADNLTASGEIREFFTITTVNGGIFFLVVDRSSGDVHLLSAVDEHDLAGFIDDNRRQSIGSSPPSTVHPQEPDEPDNKIPEPEPQSRRQGGPNPIPILIFVFAAGGGAYYWKIIRPKKLAGTDDYEDEDNPPEGEDDEPEMQFEPEQDDGGDDNGEEGYYDEREDDEPV